MFKLSTSHSIVFINIYDLQHRRISTVPWICTISKLEPTAAWIVGPINLERSSRNTINSFVQSEEIPTKYILN